MNERDPINSFQVRPKRRRCRPEGHPLILFPRELDGLGLDHVSFAIAAEEIASADASTGLIYVRHVSAAASDALGVARHGPFEASSYVVADLRASVRRRPKVGRRLIAR